MSPDLLVVVASLAAWGAVTGIAHFATRFGRPTPGPRSADPPDDLPPGAVAYLVGGPGSEQATIAATLLDLAARGAVVLEESGDATAPTTVRPGAQVQSLGRLESLVLERVTGVGRGGPLPLPALAPRAGEPDSDWVDLVRDAVIETTRARGLSRARAGWLLRCALVVAAAVPALAVGASAAARSEDRSELFDSAFAFAALVLIGLLGPTWGRFGGERLTRSGRRTVSAWLGHGRALLSDVSLCAARPVEVTALGRRLVFGHALGLAQGVDRGLRFGPGDRRRVWSSYGGRWHQVEVRYPRGLLVGRNAPNTALYGLWLVGVVGACVFALFWVPAAFGLSPRRDVLVLARAAGLVVLLAVAGYVLLRVVGTILEIGRERTIVGEVVWLQEHHVGHGENGSWVETYHLAVDDGTSDRSVAWSLPAELRDGCATGDHVRMTVRRRSRSVRTIERLAPS